MDNVYAKEGVVNVIPKQYYLMALPQGVSFTWEIKFKGGEGEKNL